MLEFEAGILIGRYYLFDAIVNLFMINTCIWQNRSVCKCFFVNKDLVFEHNSLFILVYNTKMRLLLIAHYIKFQLRLPSLSVSPRDESPLIAPLAARGARVLAYCFRTERFECLGAPRGPILCPVIP